MGIPVEKQFVIGAARGDVWAFLTDPSRVAGCLPGAAITEQVDERTHAGTIAVKVGPVSARYKGTVRFERLDEEEGVAEIVAAGQDVRGKGGAEMRMTSRVVARGPAETEVTVASTVNITGILAQFGRGMIQDVSDEMFRRFTDAMRAALESAPDRAGAGDAAADRPAAASPAAGGTSGSPAADGTAASVNAGNASAPASPAADGASASPSAGSASASPDADSVHASPDTDGASASPAAGSASASPSAGSASASPDADSADAARTPPRPAAGPAAQPRAAAADGDAIDAVSLGATVGKRALGRLVRRPGFWLAVVIAAAILWLIVS